MGVTLRKQAVANNITLEEALKLGYPAKKRTAFMPDSEVWSCGCDSKTTTKPSVELFQDAKKYAEKHLLKHNVQIEYSAKSKRDYYGRYLVSVYYDCNKESNCKSYEEKILKA